MDESDFEGTIVLERLAEVDLLDAFWEAVDGDDTRKAASLMKRARIDSKTIAIVLKKMTEADGEH